MITKCKNCGSSLTFDADMQMMVCDYCTSMFPVYSMEADDAQTIADEEAAAADGPAYELADFRIYHCSSCGAELVMNDVEATTDCAYCGQPTIVFEKIAKRRKPDYIIPFMVSKKEAIELVRKEFGKSSYVSEEMRAFKPEMMRGVFIPFGVYDIIYEDRQLLSGEIEYDHGKEHRPCNFFRHVRAKFRGIPVDASVRLPNNYSERLEPYKIEHMEPFKAEYLSGFYADLGDEDFNMIKQRAAVRAGWMFDEQMISRIMFGRNLSIVKKHPQHIFTREDYALFPAWFLIFEHNGQKYTILVNGQTGKVFGSVPVDFKQFVKQYAFVTFWLSLICIVAMPFLFLYMGSFVVALLASMVALFAGFFNFYKLCRNIRFTKEKSIQEFAADRKRG